MYIFKYECSPYRRHFSPFLDFSTTSPPPHTHPAPVLSALSRCRSPPAPSCPSQAVSSSSRPHGLLWAPGHHQGWVGSSLGWRSGWWESAGPPEPPLFPWPECVPPKLLGQGGRETVILVFEGLRASFG